MRERVQEGKWKGQMEGLELGEKTTKQLPFIWAFSSSASLSSFLVFTWQVRGWVNEGASERRNKRERERPWSSRGRDLSPHLENRCTLCWESTRAPRQRTSRNVTGINDYTYKNVLQLPYSIFDIDGKPLEGVRGLWPTLLKGQIDPEIQLISAVAR